MLLTLRAPAEPVGPRIVSRARALVARVAGGDGIVTAVAASRRGWERSTPATATGD